MSSDGSGDGVDATLRELGNREKVFARYTLIKILGRGGMGIVWLARDEELEREVALKFLPDLIVHDRALLSDLKRETKRSLELTHKNIMRIYDFVNDEGSACISMEYVDGDTLSNLRAEKEQKVFHPNEIAGWTSQLCDALDYAHNHARIIHRDLKPANLMVNRRGDLKVSDFGIARSLSDTASRLTLEQGRSGTLVYMSPQQLDGERGTHLDDIYSLGATLYDLLTSKPPFYSGNIDRQVHERIPPSMTERRRDLNIEPASVPAVWEETVAACLAKDPAKRPQSTAEVASRLQLSAPSARGVTFTTPRRKKILLWAELAAAVCLMVIGGWYFAKGKFRTKTPVPVSQQALAQPSLISEKSIAVLPFDSFSDDKENAYFADGVQDDILIDLTKVADLKVISRRSVSQYRGSTKDIREIGQALRVAYVLEGSVRKTAGKIHVTAQLSDTRSETQKWAEKYDRELADIFAIQSEISQAIVVQLKATLSPAEKAAIETPPTQDVEAYDLYLRARALLYTYGLLAKTIEDNRPKAEKLLEAAIARDPKFVLAYCLLAEVQWTPEYAQNPSPERLAKARATFETALRLAPDSGEVHLALASYYSGLTAQGVTTDKKRAEEELAVAARKLPNSVDVIDALAQIEEDHGQWSEALGNLRKATQLDPRNPDIAQYLIELYADLRWFSEAEKLIDRTIASLSPDATGPLWRRKGIFAREKGDTRVAMAAFDAHPKRNAGLAGLNFEIAQVLLYEHKFDEARKLIESFDEMTRTHNLLGSNPFAEGHQFEVIGIIERAQKHQEKARAAFEKAHKEFAAWLVRRPEEPLALGYSAICAAGVGEKELALREARHALEVWPMSREPLAAAKVSTQVALVYAWTGDREAAIRELGAVAKVPGGPSPGDLKLNPRWDDLRNDPRFDKIIAAASEPVKIE